MNINFSNGAVYHCPQVRSSWKVDFQTTNVFMTTYTTVLYLFRHGTSCWYRYAIREIYWEPGKKKGDKFFLGGFHADKSLNSFLTLWCEANVAVKEEG